MLIGTWTEHSQVMAIPDRGLDLPWYSWGDVPFNGPLTDFDLDPPFQPHSFTHVTPDTSFRGGLSTSQGIDGSLVNAQSSIVEPTYHHVEGSALAVVAPEDGNTNAGGDPYNPGGLFIQSSSYNETQKVPYIHPAHTSLPVPPLFNSGLSIAEVNLQQKGVTAVYDKPYLTQSWMEQSPEYHFSSQQSARLSSPPMNAQAFGVSRLPAERFASPQYPVHQLLQSQHHGYTTVDDFDPNLLAAPIVSYPLSPYALTGERYQSYAPPHSTGPLPSRNQTMREIYSSVGEQREEVRSITALPWSSGPHSIDNELLPPNDWVNDNVAPSGDFGMHILRTSSPEHFHTEAHVQPGPSSSFPIRALHSRRAQILHRDSMVGLETSESARSTMVARGSSGSESFGTISSRPSASGSSGSSASWRPSPQHSIGESPNRTRTRIKPSDKAKEKTRELRNSKTVCEHCIQAHKKIHIRRTLPTMSRVDREPIVLGASYVLSKRGRSRRCTQG
ncbi:uncharacterized protein LY89DRAFT_266857 [Mollisia scopiformis]|uniref:Uncharacterized protein n=1 Tax=Mollisia scopiformis TaxID=149040 RepID=A0A132BCH0_MOLSC|nr:uncharacterized protein LY89DRAFT_266857 [Mollisia scopiformis]KUJ09953.1 hypothetical protein LY89DRAFT_266857 [Mollisia scopiformis]